MLEESEMWSMLCIMWQYCHLNGGLSCDHPIKFMIKYGVSRKIRLCQVHEFVNIYDMIRRAFQPTMLAQGFKF